MHLSLGDWDAALELYRGAEKELGRLPKGHPNSALLLSAQVRPCCRHRCVLEARGARCILPGG